MIPWGYTVPALLAVPAVVIVELRLLRTGLFHRPTYWVSMGIVFGFQIPMDGWLTKLSAPIVRYSPADITGIRFPWDIPVEDFLFGFALVTAALLLWERGTSTNDGHELARPTSDQEDGVVRSSRPNTGRARVFWRS